MTDYSKLVRKMEWEGDVLHVHDVVKEISDNMEKQMEEVVLNHFDCDLSDLRDYLRNKAEWRQKQKQAIPRWTPVEEGLPQERDTIFARFYGTEKWKPGMIRRVSDDVRVVAVFDDGTAMVWHDHTVDGVWSCEKYEINLQRKITHWMENPELPKEQEEMK